MPGESKERNGITFHSTKRTVKLSAELMLQPGRLSRWERQGREAWMHSGQSPIREKSNAKLGEAPGKTFPVAVKKRR